MNGSRATCYRAPHTLTATLCRILLLGWLWSLSANAAQPTRWMFASPNIHPMTTQSGPTSATTAMATSSVSSVSPDYPVTRLRFAFSNWFTASRGEARPEQPSTAPITLAASLLVDGQLFARLQFDGEQIYRLAPGQNVWSDPVTVPDWRGQRFEIRTWSQVDAGQPRPGSYRITDPQADNGKGVVYSSDNSLHQQLLNGAPMQDNSFGKFKHYFGPSAMISDGWDGRGVVLILGDSIGFGSYFGQSFITQGLEADGWRTPYLNMAVQGTRPSGQADATPGSFALKLSLLNDTARLNNGALPFTHVLSQYGVNDAYADDGEKLYHSLMTFIKFIHRQWPEIPIYQTTLTPKTAPDRRWYHASASQQRSLSPVDSDRWQLERQLTPPPAPLAGVIDLRSAWTGAPSGTRWRTFDYKGQLQAEAESGSRELLLDTPPPIGAKLVLEAGSENVEGLYGEVIACSDQAPYRVTLSSALKRRHPRGATVLLTMTRDGIHPTGHYALSFGAAPITRWRDQVLRPGS